MKPLRLALLVLGSTALALAGAEVVLRRAWPVRSVTYRLDPVLLHDSIPRSRRLQRMPEWAGGGRHLVRFNSLGCRGPELAEPGRGPRVVVVGDSLVLAANLDEERTFPARLALHLGACEVVNAGLESYGPDQTLLRLERDLEALAPDLVVLVLCATNDFGDLLRNKLFELEGDRARRVRPTLSEAAREPFERHAREARAPAIARTFLEWRESRAAARAEARARPLPELVPEYLAQAAWEYENTVVQRDRTVYSLQQDAYDADVALLPGTASAGYKRSLMTAVLKELLALCRGRDVPLVATVVPSAIDLDPGFWIRVDPARYPLYRREALVEALEGCAREAGIDLVPLASFASAPDPSALFVGRDDFHWSARGADLAAREVAAGLRERGLPTKGKE